MASSPTLSGALIFDRCLNRFFSSLNSPRAWRDSGCFTVTDPPTFPSRKVRLESRSRTRYATTSRSTTAATTATIPIVSIFRGYVHVTTLASGRSGSLGARSAAGYRSPTWSTTTPRESTLTERGQTLQGEALSQLPSYRRPAREALTMFAGDFLASRRPIGGRRVRHVGHVKGEQTQQKESSAGSKGAGSATILEEEAAGGRDTR